MKKTVLAAILAFAAGSVSAAPSGRAAFKPTPPSPGDYQSAPRDGTRLLLVGAIFDPTIQEPDFSQVGLPAGADGVYAIVQFQPGHLDAKDELAAAGVSFVGYLPDNAFQVRLNDEARALLAANAAVRFMGPYKAGYKVHPRLWPGSGDAA